MALLGKSVALRRLLAAASFAVIAAVFVMPPMTRSGTVLGFIGDPLERTLDDDFAAVAERVPEFGGMFLGDNEATLYVYLTEDGRATRLAVRTAIVSVFGAGVIPRHGIMTLRGRYGFLQLKQWYDQVVGVVLGIEGVFSTDIDEARNRLRIGGAIGARREVVEALDALGVPREAVAFGVGGRAAPLAHTLNSTVPQVHGGYAITRLTAPSGISTATLGFNASRSGVNGFVTNSHHSQVWFLVDPLAGYPAANYYQGALYIPSTFIGTETIDPTGPPCPPPYPASYNCRMSDSLFAAYTPTAQWAQGILARTLALSLWNGAAPCDPANPQCIRAVSHAFGNNVGPGMWGISNMPSMPYLHGLRLHKVGRTTGWTTGTMEGTCVDYVWNANGVNVLTTTVLRCQYQVGNQFDADPTNDWWRIATFGDSGSPVFRIRSSAFKHVELYGIAWGGNTFSNSFGAKKFVFSPIRGVQADLGVGNFVGQCLPPFPAC